MNDLSSHPFLDGLTEFSALPFLITPSGVYTYQDLKNRFQQYRSGLSGLEIPVLGVRITDAFDFLALLFAAESLGKTAVVLSSNLSEAEIEVLAKLTSFTVLVTDSPISFSGKKIEASSLRGKTSEHCKNYQPGKIVLTTSGSTGTPKGAVRSWEKLLKGISIKKENQKAVWLLTYDFTSFAGMQVILHALLNGAQLMVPGEDLLGALEGSSVTHLSATPSFWRKMLVQLKSGRDIPHLQHITLGGEAVTQDLLDKIVKFFPEVPVTQIYASTEMGACFYVRDKKAGLPKEALTASGEIQAKVVGDELYIRSARAMESYAAETKGCDAEGWFATGDIVQVTEDRIHFVSRKQAIINVGGFKVYPYEVEEVIYKVQGVLHVRVSGEKSSVLGEIVRADVEAAPGIEDTELEAAIRSQCQKELARAKVPRVIKIIRESLIKGSKVSRRTN